MNSKKNPKQSVAGVIFDEGREKILLVKRRDVPIWVLPGGGVEANELPERAIEREVFEETGLHISVKKQIAFYIPVNRLAYETFLFECGEISGSLTTGDETESVKFFPLDKLPEPFFFIHEEWLNDALNNFAFPIEKKLTQVSYCNFLSYFLRHPIHVFRFLLSCWGLPLNTKQKS